MVRYTYIQNEVLKVYSALPTLSFPLCIKDVISYIPNCKYMSYQKFAKINHCSIDDVVQICESKSGCTHYDVKNDRYLILTNLSTDNNNNIGRQRWTCGHEIGHIICNHHAILLLNQLSENNISQITNPEYEAEADFFAATLLSPFPLFRILNINSISDVQNVFGLSSEASFYRYKQYLTWLKTRVKTSWENDIIHLYKQKGHI